MNAIVCGIVAWMYFASRLPATPLSAAQAQERISGASAMAGCAKSISALGWWKSSLPWAHELLATPDTYDVPMHMLIGFNNRHGTQKRIAIHQFTQPVPDGFLWEIQPPQGLDSLQVVSPAGYLVLRSGQTNQTQLAMLASILCGDFLCNPYQDNARYFRDALCSTDAIGAVIVGISDSMRGIKALKSVLPYVANGAHSPMETVIQLALSLPPRLGGCGLPTPELNAKLEVTGELSLLLSGSRYISPDGLWPARRIGYEYDSHQEHDNNPLQVEKDRRRRDVMERLGYQMVVFDRESCRNERMRNLCFERLAKLLKRPFDWSGAAQQKRRDLWNKLMAVGLCW